MSERTIRVCDTCGKEIPEEEFFLHIREYGWSKGDEDDPLFYGDFCGECAEKLRFIAPKVKKTKKGEKR